MNWVIGTFVASTVTALTAVGAVAYAANANAEAKATAAKQHADLEAKVASQAAQLGDRLASARRRGYDTTWDHCSATAFAYDCSFTNNSEEPITVCVQGTLVNKESPGVTLKTMPLCSGRVLPGATEHVSVAYKGGSPVDICNSPGYGGRKEIDFDKCDLKYDDLPPPAAAAPARPAAQAPKPTTVAAAEGEAPIKIRKLGHDSQARLVLATPALRGRR